MANSCWWTRSDGWWWNLTIRKTQPAVISKGDHLLITVISNRNSSPSHYLAWQAALSEVRLCSGGWKHCLFRFSHCCFQSFFSRCCDWENHFEEDGGKTTKSIWLVLAVLLAFAIIQWSDAFVWAVNWQSACHITIQMVTAKHLQGGHGLSQWKRERYVILLMIIYSICVGTYTNTHLVISSEYICLIHSTWSYLMKPSFTTVPLSPRRWKKGGKSVTGYVRESKQESQSAYGNKRVRESWQQDARHEYSPHTQQISLCVQWLHGCQELAYIIIASIMKYLTNVTWMYAHLSFKPSVDAVLPMHIEVNVKGKWNCSFEPY